MSQPKLQSLSDIADLLERVLQENQKLQRQLREAVTDRITLHVQYVEAHADLTRKQSEFEAREKLTKDEFERRIQGIQVEFRKERHQLEKLLTAMKNELATCICKGDGVARAMAKPAPAPPRLVEKVIEEEPRLATANRQDAARARQQAWMIRNGK